MGHPSQGRCCQSKDPSQRRIQHPQAEAVVTKQQGSVLHGTFQSPRATEKFVAVIAEDNKSIYYADEDRFLEGQISNKDQINVIYRHLSSSDTIVAVGTWTKKK